MQELLNNPAFQAGIAPFVIGLLAALVLRRLGGTWASLAVLAGFFTTVALITDISFSPLNSTRKIILLSLVAAAVGLLRDLLPVKDRVTAVVLFAGGATAAVWVVWPVVQRQEWLGWITMGGGGALYAGWATVAFDGLRGRADRASAAALAFGWGSGGAALLGASAFLGQLGIAIGMASAALLFVIVVLGGARVGAPLTLPVGLVAALLGFAATIYAELPWYVLVVLASIPLAARVPLPGLPRWSQALLLVAVTSLPAAAAVAITWAVAGPLPI